MQGLRVIFAGTPTFAAHHLQTLIDQGRHEIAAVYTQPDRPSGRGKKLAGSAVKKIAEQHQLSLCQPASLKDDEVQRQLADLKADLMLVVAYGLILPKAVLIAPRLGCINVHASLLPRWRGAAPVQRAIEAGDIHTGITIMQMDEGLDTGPIHSSIRCDILDADTAGSLQDKLAVIGSEALLATLDGLVRGETGAQIQDESLATYAHKISKEEALLDWSLSAVMLDRKIRAFNPMPVAFTTTGKERVRIWQAIPVRQKHGGPPGTVLSSDSNGILVACGSDALLLTEIQLAGKRRMLASEVLQGRTELFDPGIQLGICA